MYNILKKVIGNVILAFISILLSYILCYKLIDDILVSITISKNIFIGTRIILALALFIFIKCIIDKKINTKSIDLLFCLYFIFIITSTLFKSNSGWTGNINLNPLTIFQDIKSSSNAINLLLGNICIYIPIGIYIEHKFLNKNVVLKIVLFVIYIFVVEVIQHISKIGVFDINDILLNLSGFLIGIYFQKGIRKIRKDGETQ